MIYDFSKQALSYIEIRDVALLHKVSTDPNLFLQKSRITGSLQFLHSVVLHIFIELSRIFHSCQKSKIMHEHIKVKELSSWYEFRPSVLSLSPCHSIYLATKVSPSVFWSKFLKNFIRILLSSDFVKNSDEIFFTEIYQLFLLAKTYDYFWLEYW